MLDSIQILLTVVISVLTVLLTIIGLAIYQILKEFKISVEKINLILNDTHRMTAAVAQPVEDASEFLHGVKSGVNFIKSAAKILKEEKEDEKKTVKKTEKEDEKSSVTDENQSQEEKKVKRFFKKAGKILSKTI
ncbi:hypothetical protein ACFLZ1_04960 [Patescibacteria group bacterium]